MSNSLLDQVIYHTPEQLPRPDIPRRQVGCIGVVLLWDSSTISRNSLVVNRRFKGAKQHYALVHIEKSCEVVVVRGEETVAD